MATIERTYGADGRVEVEPLYHMLFTLEKGAHTFVITIENGDVLAEATDVFARFRRSDGQTVHIVGTLSDVTATVTLPETCYNAPGPFGLSIFVTNEAISTEIGGSAEPTTVCVYACVGQVAPTTTDDVITEEAYPTTSLKELIETLLQDGVAFKTTAAFARNVGDIEAEMQTIHGKLIEQGFHVLTEPNMLSQGFWTNIDSVNKIYGQTNKCFGSRAPYIRNATNRASATAGEDPDEISETLISLSGNDVVTDLDGSVYDKAIAFTVANAPEQGYNNADDLVFNYGNDRWDTASPPADELGITGQLDMTVGQEYTLSCWARITNGTQARLHFMWSPLKSVGCSENNHYEDITNAAWKRVSWTFVFAPTGSQTYTYDSPKNVDGVETTVNRTAFNWLKKVAIGVCRKYDCTVQLCGFRLTAGQLYDTTDYSEIKNAMAALTARVEALERG